MFKYKVKLFKLLGFTVEVDASWLLLAVLVSWTLSAHYFPTAHKGLTVTVYWQMGIAGMIGLFASLILHELSHSVVARRFGLPISGITLFVFGGVAQLEDEPANPQTEFWMAIAGPIASLALAILFWILSALSVDAAGLTPHGTVLAYLALVNFVLMAFNLVPGFPLDGGRVLRAFLWWRTGDLRWSTKIACNIGDIAGIALIILGIFNLFTGNVIAGIWQALIGMFLRTAATSSYSQLVTKDILANKTAGDLMTDQPVIVSLDMSLARLVDDYVLAHNHNWFPVEDNKGVVGFVNMAGIQAVPREKWDVTNIRDILVPAGAENTVEPDATALDVLNKMNRYGMRKLLVVSGGRLVGILSLSDLMKFIGLRLELQTES